MTTVSVIGAQDKTVELPEEIFAAKVNVPLIHQVVLAPQAAARSAAAAGSRTGRRAQAAPGKAPCVRRNMRAAASRTARYRARTCSGRRRR